MEAPSLLNIKLDQVIGIVENRQDILMDLLNQTFYLVENDELRDILCEAAIACTEETGTPTGLINIEGNLTQFYFVNFTWFLYTQGKAVYIGDYSDPADLCINKTIPIN